jgi:hypothetical protein
MLTNTRLPWLQFDTHQVLVTMHNQDALDPASALASRCTLACCIGMVVQLVRWTGAAAASEEA